jgi:hypothetical protein
MSKDYIFLPKSAISGAAVVIVQRQLLRSVLKEIEDERQPEAESMFGTPVYDTFTFGSVENEANNIYLDSLGDKQTYKTLRLHEVIIEVNQVKNIVLRSVQGRKNTIKQYISDGDYTIRLSGYLSGKYNTDNHSWSMFGENFPDEGLRRLKDILKVPARLNVTSRLLSIFGITGVVVIDYNIPQRVGQGNRQYFEVNMLSDEEILFEFSIEEVEDEDKLRTILNV